MTMASKLAAQLYTLRDFTKTPDDITATLKKVAALGYEAVQLSALGPIDPAQLRSVCDGEGLSICATHISFERMRDETAAVIEEHDIYGCPYVGIGGMPAEYRTSGEGFSRFAQEASSVAGKLKEAGQTFVYHNHSFELQRFGDRTGLQILLEDSDPRSFMFELDTYWVQHGGGSPVAWIEAVSGRLPVIHFKDMQITAEGTQIYAEVGEGNLDWQSIIDACDLADVQWYIIEQDVCLRDPFESLEISLHNLKNMGVV